MAEWDRMERRKDNWTLITAETRKIIGRKFKDEQGRVFSFFGVVDGYEDYYYGMYSKEHGMALLSCVGSIGMHGYSELPSKSYEDMEREHYERRMAERARDAAGGSTSEEKK